MRWICSERVSLGLIAGHFILLPWWLGSVELPAHYVVFVTSTILAAQTWGRIRAARHPAAGLTPLYPPSALIFAAAFGIYVVLQAVHPLWVFRSDVDHWWLEPIAAPGWWPGSVQAPWERGNAWRVVLIFVSLLFTLHAVRCGLLRRSSYIVLLTLLTASGVVLSLLGIVQKLRNSPWILGQVRPANDWFFATFNYPNHAGAYLLLMMASAFALWKDYRARSSSAQSQQVIGTVFLATILTLYTGLLFTASRLAVILGTLLVCWEGMVVVIRHRQRPLAKRNPRGTIWLVGAMIAVLALGITTWQTQRVSLRFRDALAAPGAALEDRLLVQRATWDMFSARPIFGWGAGGFQYVFPLFAQHYSAIYINRFGQHRFWEHAHSEYLQFASEFGMVGCALMALPAFLLLRAIRRQKPWRDPLRQSLGAGCLLVAFYAQWDFVFRSPAVLFTFLLLLCVFGGAPAVPPHPRTP